MQMEYSYVRDIAFWSKNRNVTDSLINPSTYMTPEKVRRRMDKC
jgi:hypothetical protein